MFDKITKFVKRLFVKDDGSINLRTVLITAAATIAGAAGMLGEGGISGAVSVGAMGLVAAGISEVLIPSGGNTEAPNSPENQMANGAPRTPEMELAQETSVPRGIPAQPRQQGSGRA